MIAPPPQIGSAHRSNFPCHAPASFFGRAHRRAPAAQGRAASDIADAPALNLAPWGAQARNFLVFSSQRRAPVGWWTAALPLPKAEAEETLGLGSAAGARKPRPPRDRKAERLRCAASSMLSRTGRWVQPCEGYTCIAS